MSGEVTAGGEAGPADEPPVPESPVPEPPAGEAQAPVPPPVDAEGLRGRGVMAWLAAGLMPVPAPPPVVAWRRAGERVDAALAMLTSGLLWQRWRENEALRVRVPQVLTLVMCIWYFVVFERLVWLRHEHFGTFDYDLGMYDQGIWQLAHGRGFMTVRGMHVFGHHANVGYLLLVPFYWLGIGGPQFLDLVNTLAVVAVAVPVFFLARRFLDSAWAGLFLVFAYLGHFAPQWKIQETFHTESIAAPFIVGALYFAATRRWRWYWVCLVLAVIWKEDVALATAMLGLAVGVMFREVRVMLITIAGSALWFLVATRGIMAYFAPDGAVFDSLFGPLGASAGELVHTSLVHPSRLITTVRCHGWWDGKLRFLLQPTEGVVCPDPAALSAPNQDPRGLATLMQPYGMLAFGQPPLLATGLPQHTVNSATTAGFTWDLRWHYAMFPYLGVLMGSVVTVIRRKRRVFAWLMIAVMVVGVVATKERGVGPWTTNHDVGYWPLTSAPVHTDYRAAIADVPDDAHVTASYFLVPHLSHREYVYTFPNPWVSSNYGAGGTEVELPDQNSIDQLVVDRAALNPTDQALFDKIMDSGQFDVAYRSKRSEDGRISDVIRLERQGDGPPITPG